MNFIKIEAVKSIDFSHLMSLAPTLFFYRNQIEVGFSCKLISLNFKNLFILRRLNQSQYEPKSREETYRIKG